MKKSFIKVNKLTSYKYLNFFEVDYKLENGKIENYFFASRRKFEDIEINKKGKIDAIKILPYFKKNNTIYVVLNYEFRSPMNDYSYDLCAGLVEDGETLEENAKRELKEELGVSIKNIKKVTESGYTSAGLTDETMCCYLAEVESFGKQNLEDTEDINIKIVELKDIPQFLKNNQFGLIGELLLRLFYEENKNNL
jgi:ADP-ribose pyrophosphatase